MKLSKRGNVSPFIVMEVMRAAAAREAGGGSVLHLEVGQPATSAPGKVLAAASRALHENQLGYTLALGLPELRRSIAQHYWDTYSVKLPEQRIIVTVGASGAFLLSFLALFDPGDRVAIAEPGYPAYRNILSALNIEPVAVPCGPASDFQPTPELLQQAAGARPLDGVLLASPANPTGAMIAPEMFAALGVWCNQRGIPLISDEIYHGITYGVAAQTALAFNPDAIVINSFSKYFSMTGWRLGWMVAPERLLRTVERLAQNFFISPPTLPQIAAIAAFECHDELRGNVAVYARNRELLLRELPKAGLTQFAPADGAFYLYADISALSNDSETFCRDMLACTGVAATPGIDFDNGRGRRYVRFSFAGATETMAEAARRLQQWLS